MSVRRLLFVLHLYLKDIRTAVLSSPAASGVAVSVRRLLLSLSVLLSGCRLFISRLQLAAGSNLKVFLGQVSLLCGGMDSYLGGLALYS